MLLWPIERMQALHIGGAIHGNYALKSNITHDIDSSLEGKTGYRCFFQDRNSVSCFMRLLRFAVCAESEGLYQQFRRDNSRGRCIDMRWSDIRGRSGRYSTAPSFRVPRVCPAREQSQCATVQIAAHDGMQLKGWYFQPPSPNGRSAIMLCCRNRRPNRPGAAATRRPPPDRADRARNCRIPSD
jgi:hypothetical protein